MPLQADSVQRILYVEDDPDIRAVAELALVDVGGFEVLLCESGPEALDKIDGFGPDLVLLDVMMPVMDGPETLRALRARPGGLDAPVVFMTARLQPSEVEEYLEMGAIGVIPKPFDPMTLADQIRQLFSSNRDANQPDLR